MKPLPVRVQCLTSRTGILHFDKNVSPQQCPAFTIQGQRLQLSPCPSLFFAQNSGYYCDKKHVVFYLTPALVLKTLYRAPSVFLVSGEFNQWERDINYTLNWEKKEKAWCLKIPKNRLPSHPFAFKFVTLDGQWVDPDAGWANIHYDSQGNRNFWFNDAQNGANWVRFESEHDFDFSEPLTCRSDDFSCLVDVLPWLSRLSTEIPLGVKIYSQGTSFACFAPQAKRMEVKLFKKDFEIIQPLRYERDGVWVGDFSEDYTGYRYVYRIWNPSLQEVVDPYAPQLLSAQGPGLITTLQPASHAFITPALKDLTIVEVHVRDLLEHTPGPQTGSVFSRLHRFLSKKNYLYDLGINCVEFMPLTEFDSDTDNGYQWGYMPAHYFSLSSRYGTPEEFQQCVQTLHQRGIAVIMDVVYNHAGEMNDLIRWNPAYYFRHTTEGFLTNASGCGNDLQTEMPRVKRLICDSLLHFLKIYQVDGFRFDLAELLDLDTLRCIEGELKAYKSDVILIAEPWSFRGHIAYLLKESSYSCWNDGYREFLNAYVQGNGNTEGLKYFMAGSTSYLCRHAQQSINYTESHDDYCWQDRLGDDPELKRRQTHCMFAILLLSCGIPMLAEGQDFRRSKAHVRNTYNRGDLNALNYETLEQNADTHRYVQQLLRLRASALGDLLKVDVPAYDYFRYFATQNSSALGVLFNANQQCGELQLLFVINPHASPATFDFSTIDSRTFFCIANTDVFLQGNLRPLPSILELRSYSCAIFTNAPQEFYQS